MKEVEDKEEENKEEMEDKEEESKEGNNVMYETE